MIKAPVWKDTVYRITGDTFDYAVKVGGVTVWTDVAYRLPGNERIEIYMNRIAADYMEGNLAFTTGLTSNPKEYVEFGLYRKAGDTLTLMETYGFLFSFEGEWNGETRMLSNPINGVLDSRMLMPFTAYSGGTVLPTWYLYFNTYQYNVPADIEEGTQYSFYVTDTNLPYSASTSEKLTGGDWDPGITSYGYYYGDGTWLDMCVPYTSPLGELKDLHDTTNTDGRVYIELKPNLSGQVRRLKYEFRLTTTNELIQTIDIIQQG